MPFIDIQSYDLLEKLVQSLGFLTSYLVPTGCVERQVTKKQTSCFRKSEHKLVVKKYSVGTKRKCVQQKPYMTRNARLSDQIPPGIARLHDHDEKAQSATPPCVMITFSNDVAVNNPLPDAWKDSELAGSVDPNTIFVGEELGNYEPKTPEVPSNQPEHLKEKLDKYIKRFDGKVKLVRTDDREGLIRARTIGAKHSTGDVVIFLDAHCEVNVNWLPPLLAPIKHNRRVMTVPVIDGIDSNTWEYRSVYGQADRHFSSPTHAGGLFAIDRLWFQELGYYDEGLQIWGGEQYELSFKIWQCGGGILFVPCSHVGHVYRSHMPYSFGKLSGKPIIATNMLRVIRTWMDEYAEYYFIREPQAQRVNPGDISAQLALKERLHCKPFKW
ncbi:glycosyltransferase, group 2 family protein [Teladorsagia circumcincta]|uniref:Glycosyltransferase, group 2 family protein n=1 Tax=Teladorsagia circumcincta TaxID=45464 RepID=A0A2G9UK66_TELCI|nr:glycosyltransferase, group 2 family protein [Teladorsagia circumcincta]